MKPRVALINPNTTVATTLAMVRLAADAMPEIEFLPVTVAKGPPVITEPKALAQAAADVAALADHLPEGISGVITAAFGDPGLEELRAALAVPVTGIAEAGMLAAAEGRRRFCVVTTTPELAAPIKARAEAYGLEDSLTSVRLTAGDVHQVMADPERLEAALAEVIRFAISEDEAEAIVIGGGPLAVAARALAGQFSVPIIEPVPEAARRIARLIRRSGV
ncbi:aspartate/glutamate racemase family protein [Pannonibacter indicus]|uniref:Asp/Glu/hydantoin racemase n=1 Tax=Pannonibacter indicus TaxID=466044 RepID=A0A0K6I8L8_9HYPH|nr:aspartate/glutamate racemase family protein [Pannonibacter indicus]CUA99637.1 Asp/Glu/hydantoin racemase [Pannonibacter indicus]